MGIRLIDVEAAEHAYRQFMVALGLDVNSAGTSDTPRRVAKAIAELTASSGKQLRVVEDGPAPFDAPAHPHQINLSPFESPSNSQLIVVRDIVFSSLCEHHHLPFTGNFHIGYVARDRVVGLSKFARIVDFYSKKPQMQERLTDEVADFLLENVRPYWLIVRVNATHQCCTARGARSVNSRTVTTRVFCDPEYDAGTKLSEFAASIA
jgi:GTP cyclohydrolase I